MSVLFNICLGVKSNSPNINLLVLSAAILICAFIFFSVLIFFAAYFSIVLVYYEVKQAVA